MNAYIEHARVGLAEHLDNPNEVEFQHVRGHRWRLAHPDTDNAFAIVVGQAGERFFFIVQRAGSCFTASRGPARYSEAGAWRAAGAEAGRRLAGAIRSAEKASARAAADAPRVAAWEKVTAAADAGTGVELTAAEVRLLAGRSA